MAIAISVAALLLSALSFAYNHRANKRDLMIRVHDQLLAPERQDGRRLLFEMCEHGRSPQDLSDAEFRSVNNALAWLEFMAMLAERRYIPRKDALASWGLTSMRTVEAAERSGFLALRDTQQGSTVWPYIRKFAATARQPQGVAGAASAPTGHT